MTLIRRGDRGPVVGELRRSLTALGLLPPDSDPAESVFDDACEQAVRGFQQSRGMLTDGIVGRETGAAFSAARWRLGDRPLARTSGPAAEPVAGDDVSALQEWLLEMGYDVGRPDSVFGSRTERALRTFQREVGIGCDGVCGPGTVQALRKLGRRIVGGRPLLMREDELLRHRGRELAGKRILIDPGHGGGAPGVQVGRTTESDVVAGLAKRFTHGLVAEGVHARSTHDLLRLPSDDVTRAGLANDLDADLLISLHVDAHINPAANGLATYYFGTGSGVTSTVGERVAGLVHDELLARAPFSDCRTHGRSWELLRLTRMPAVRIELGYLTSPHDRAILTEPATQDALVDGLMAGVRSFYAPVELDDGLLVAAR